MARNQYLVGLVEGWGKPAIPRSLGARMGGNPPYPPILFMDWSC